MTNGKYKAEDGWVISKFNDTDVFDIETGLPLNSITINLDKNEILNYKLTITNYKCTDYNWNISLEEQEKIIECFRSLDIEPNISFYRDGGIYTPHYSDLTKVDSKYPIAVGVFNDALIRELSDFAKKLEYEEGKNTGALKTDENGEIYFDKQSIADEKILEKIDVLIWEKVNNRFIEIKKRYGIQNEEFFQEYFHFSEEPGKVRIENKNGIGLSKQLLFIQSVLYDTSDNIWIPTYEVEGNIFHKQEEITPTSSETPSSETPTTSVTSSSETPTTSVTSSSETPTTSVTSSSETPTTSVTSSSETPTTSETPSSKTPTTSETPSSETPTTSETPSSKTPTTSETPSSKTPTNSDTPIVKEPTNTTINTTETITTTKNNTPIIQTRVINPNNTPQTKTIVNDPPNETMINDTGVKVDTGGKNVETIFGKIREIFR